MQVDTFELPRFQTEFTFDEFIVDLFSERGADDCEILNSAEGAFEFFFLFFHLVDDEGVAGFAVQFMAFGLFALDCFFGQSVAYVAIEIILLLHYNSYLNLMSKMNFSFTQIDP